MRIGSRSQGLLKLIATLPQKSSAQILFLSFFLIFIVLRNEEFDHSKMTVLRDSFVEEFSDEDDEYLGSAEFPDYWDNIDKKRKIMRVFDTFYKAEITDFCFVFTKKPLCAEWLNILFELLVV